MSDSWDFYFARVNDKIASLFVDLGMREAAPDGDNPWLLWAFVYFHNPRDDGFPGAEDADSLGSIEDSLGQAVRDAVGAALVGRITTDGRREFYFYGPSSAGFDAAVARAMAAHPTHRWTAGCEHDPEWRLYLEVLHPSPHDWQRIKNRHVIEALQKHGDSLEKQRVVMHWAYFDRDSSREQFVAHLTDRGYTVTSQGRVDDPNSRFPLSVAFERIDRVDWDSINEATVELWDLAQSLGGDYDGWETSVER